MKKMKMLVQTTLNDVVRLNAGSGRRMNGKTVLAIVIVFLLLGAGVVNSTRYITSTTDSSIYANKWNATTSQFNNSKAWWAGWNVSGGSGTTYPGKWNLTTLQFNNSKAFWLNWNATTGRGFPTKWNTTSDRSNNTEDFGHNWNTSVTQGNLSRTGFNNSKSFWTKWNVTNSSVQRFQSQWNTSGTTGSFAPNVTYITTSAGNKYPADGDNIRLAVFSLNHTGGTVYLPAGNLTIGDVQTIYLNDNTSIVGCGPKVTTVYYAGASIPFWVEYKENVTFKGFMLDMHNQGSNGIYLAATNFWVEDMEFVNTGFQSIYFVDARYGFVSNVKVRHGEHAGSHGFGILRTNQTTITNCVFENYDHDASEDAIDFSGCQNITLSNVVANGTGWHDSIKINDNSKYLLLSNIITTNASNNGIKIATSSEYISVDNFQIDTSANNGLNVQSDCNYIQLSNGVIRKTQAGNGLGLEGDNISVSNVKIIYSVTNGVSIAGTCSNVQFSNSEILYVGNYNKISSGAKGVLFSNCIISESATYGFSIDNAQFKFINCLFERNIGDAIDTTISACNNYSIIGCTFKYNSAPVPYYALDCHANDNYIIVTDNTLIGDTMDIHYTHVGIVRDNTGYYTESWGKCLVSSAGRSANITHNLTTTPTFVSLTPCANYSISTGGGSGYIISAVSSTTFRITMLTKQTANIDFYWYAKV